MGETLELKGVIEELGATFAEYQKANDERFEELKKGGNAAEHEAKLAKMEEEIKRLDTEKSELEAKMNRPDGPAQGKPSGDPEFRKAFNKWVRRGSITPEMQEKAMSAGSDADGGFAVPDELNTSVYDLLLNATPMRGICRIVNISTDNYAEIVNLRGTESGWVSETAARPETDSPHLAKIDAVMGEIYACPSATQQILDDAVFNVEQFLSSEISTQFAIQENLSFTSGDGTSKPKGFLAYPNAATPDGTRAFGTIQALSTGVADNFPATNPGDLLLDVIYALKSGHRIGARWMMNPVTLSIVRKWKDNENNYLWQPGLQAGQPSMLLGFPVTENPDMPTVGANALCVAFGDFQRAYTIVDRTGIRMLRDPYTSKPYIKFYTTKRVGGFLKDSEAVKLVMCAAAA